MNKLILYLFLALVVPLYAPSVLRADIAADDARDTYSGNGTTTSFTYNFKVLTSANIAVYQAGTLKTLTTHYTLTGVGNDAGGTVVFVTAPANGEHVLLLRNQPISQTTSYIDGSISATTIERDFDRQTSVNQQQQEEIARGLKYPKTITPTTALTELPTPVASKCIGYDGAATSLALNDCGGTGGGSAFTTSAGLFGLVTDETGGDKVVGSDDPVFTTKITTPRIDLTTCQELTGAGSPEGVVTAPVCSTYRRTDGGASTSFYVKESGSGNTGWVAYGTPAGTGAPTTAGYWTKTADGGLSDEFAMGSLATGIVKNTTTTGVPTIAVVDVDYLDPSSAIGNGQLPATISGKTFSNTNTVTLTDSLFTLQDNSDNTKQMRFELSGISAATLRTLTLPNASTRLMSDSDFSGTTVGGMRRTGTALYAICRDNDAAIANPGLNDDSSLGYCVGSRVTRTNVTPKTVWFNTDTTVGAATWVQAASTTEVQGLPDVCTINCAVITANSFAAGLHVGSATTAGIRIYDHATLGPRVVCVVGGVENACNHDQNIANTFSQTTTLNGTLAETLTSAGVHTYNALQPVKSIFWPAGALSTDGTFCAAPAEVTINSGAKRWTIICADNDGSTIYGEVEMPDSWDGGTVTLMGSFIQTAADTNAMNSDVAMACRGTGTTINNTWGTEIAMDIANMTGSSGINKVTTAAITPNGTCTGGGKLLQFRWQLDAAGSTTAMATLHVLGFKLEYAISSRSD